jgi:predicted enzyme involved in methoxymalonyl-ACP biosynthesis
LRPVERVLEVDAFLMSCRVLQRGVEQLAMNKIFEFARSNCYACVVGKYIPTAKNGMVKNFYSQFGFKQEPAPEPDAIQWCLASEDYTPREVFIRETQKT